MTILRAPIFDWQDDPRTRDLWDDAPYESASPNLIEVEKHLRHEFGGGSMGIHLDRPQRNNRQLSEHAWGASLDHGTGEEQRKFCTERNIPFGQTLSVADHHRMCDWVVHHSLELRIQAIVSIGRSWKCDRVNNGRNGWIDYNSGYTGHSHFVTTYEGFHDSTPIAQRFALPEPLPPKDKTMQFMKHPNDPHLFAVDIRHVDAATRDRLIALGVTIRSDDMTDEQLAKFKYDLGITN